MRGCREVPETGELEKSRLSQDNAAIVVCPFMDRFGDFALLCPQSTAKKLSQQLDVAPVDVRQVSWIDRIDA